MARYVKNEERSQKWGRGKCLKYKKMLCENKNKKDSAIKKIQAISMFFKFWKDNTTSSLLINIIRGATYYFLE